MPLLNIVDSFSRTESTISFDVVSTTIDPNKPTLFSTHYVAMYPYISVLKNMVLPPNADANSFNIFYWGLEFAFVRNQNEWTVAYQYSDEIFPITTP